MSGLEKKNKKRIRRANLRKIILGTIATAGALGVAAVAPNVLGAMSRVGVLPTARQKDSIRQARQRLVRQGLLEYRDGLLYLTEKGECVMDEAMLRERMQKRPRRWDKKWRMLIFDIPENRKGTRDKLRHTLRQIGFVRVQDSVWLYPYDCEDFIVLLKADFRIGKDVLYLIVDAMEADTDFRKHFGLSLD